MLRKISALFGKMPSQGNRHILSYWASRIFELKSIRQFFGVNLVAAMVLTGVITPEAISLLQQKQIESTQQITLISSAHPLTETTLEAPLTSFTVSQLFSGWHPGIDFVAPEGTPVYALESGTVESAGTSLWGYGKHVVLAHDHYPDLKSLYAHLTQIDTEIGRQVVRGELIGKVGHTGWATGNHLHLEIYEKGTPVNPLEILPLKAEDITYDGAFYNPIITASVSI